MPNKSSKPIGRPAFKFQNIGDKIKGVYIGKETIKNRLKNDEDQAIYNLKLIKNCLSGRKGCVMAVFGKPGIDYQMKNVQLGQIIQCEYIKELPAKIPGHSSTRVIEITANINEVDGPFLLAENKRLQDQLEWVKKLVGCKAKKVRRIKIKLQD